MFISNFTLLFSDQGLLGEHPAKKSSQRWSILSFSAFSINHSLVFVGVRVSISDWHWHCHLGHVSYYKTVHHVIAANKLYVGSNKQ